MSIHPLAGKPAPQSMLVNVAELISAYYTLQPDVKQQAERVTFGTSGHRGNSLHRSFNQAHILAVTQAVCDYRKVAGIHGTLFLGMDTHASSPYPGRHPGGLRLSQSSGYPWNIVFGYGYPRSLLAGPTDRTAGVGRQRCGCLYRCRF